MQPPTAGWGGALLGAAWLGSFLGMTAYALMIALTVEPTADVSELWSIPFIVVGYATFVGLPVGLIGLLVFGVPLTVLLKTWAERPWMVIVALAAGPVAGRLLYFLIDHAFSKGSYDLWGWPQADYAVLIGATTGLLWLLFARRVLRKQRNRDAPPDPLAS
jgi:hypothetical protein